MYLSSFCANAPAGSTLARVIPEMHGPRLMAVVPSHSNPLKGYEIRLGADANVYCTCPSWRFKKLPVGARACKHILGLKAQLASTIAR
jgi:hypothetical protein